MLIEKEINNIEGIAYSYSNIAEIFRITGNLAKTIEYKEKALEITQSIGLKRSIYDSYRVAYAP